MPEVRSVSTIADLKSYAVTTTMPDLLVRGYHDVNDGGGGWFRYSSTYGGAENGGTIFRPDSVAPASDGRWIRVLPQPNRYHVRWFGARGNGSTDDTQAIQNALDILQPYDVLDFAMQEADVSYRLVPATPGQPCLNLSQSNVNLVGVQGFRSPRLRCDVENATILGISGRAIGIDGLQFEGHGDQTKKGYGATVDGIHWRYVPTGTGGGGEGDDTTSGSPADLDSQITNCRFVRLVEAVNVAGRNVEVRGNAFVSCRRGLHIYAVDPRDAGDNIQTLRGWRIQDNRFHAGASSPQESETADISCIWVEPLYEGHTSGSGVTTNYEFGNLIQDNFADYDVRFYVGPLKWGEILNNHIHYARTGRRAQGDYPGIINLLPSDPETPATRGWRVAGNVISAQAGSVYDGCGIWCAASNGIIDGNVVSGIPGEAIVLTAAASNVTVSGNAIDDASREWDGAHSAVVSGYRDAILLEGSGHVVTGNRINFTQGYAVRHGIHLASGSALLGANHIQVGTHDAPTALVRGQAIYVSPGAVLAGDASNTAEFATGNLRARRRIYGDMTVGRMMRTVDRGTVFDRTSAEPGGFGGQICIESGTNGVLAAFPVTVEAAGLELHPTGTMPDLRIGDIVDIGSDKAGRRVADVVGQQITVTPAPDLPGLAVATLLPAAGGGTGAVVLIDGAVLTVVSGTVSWLSPGLSVQLQTTAAVPTSADPVYSVSTITPPRVVLEDKTSAAGAVDVTLHPPVWASREQVNLRGAAVWSTTIQMPDLAAGQSFEDTIAVTGATPPGYAVVSPPQLPVTGLVVQAYVSATDVVTVRITNLSGATLAPPRGTWRVRVFNDAPA